MAIPFVHSKLPDVGTTIFTVMSQLAIEHNAVNLGQGFPDFAMSEKLTSLVTAAMKDGFNQYTHMSGLPLLRERIAEKTEKLYKVTRSFAALTGNEVLYDLYCGTGSIGIFCSAGAKKIIGVDAVEEAIINAKENALMNGLSNTHFYAGDVLPICNDDFFAANGRPDVIITDPPRAGMHEKLVKKLLDIAAARIVYVSCNTATQARDLQLLNEKYRVEQLQPVDLFPHTHHIENVAALTLRS